MSDTVKNTERDRANNSVPFAAQIRGLPYLQTAGNKTDYWYFDVKKTKPGKSLMEKA